MQVTKLTLEQMNAVPKKTEYTEEELNQEYYYLLSKQITKKLLVNGLITEEEFAEIMAKNRQSFSSYLSELYSEESLIIPGFRGNMSPNEEVVS